MNRLKLISLPTVLSVLGCIAVRSAIGHHSYAMFDPKKLQLVGAVKEFQWTNPHIWIVVLVQNSEGELIEWGIETGSPNLLMSRGWKAKSLKPGDMVTAEIHPKRDGSNEGSLIQIIKADGTILKDRDLVSMPINAAPEPAE